MNLFGSFDRPLDNTAEEAGFGDIGFCGWLGPNGRGSSGSTATAAAGSTSVGGEHCGIDGAGLGGNVFTLPPLGPVDTHLIKCDMKVKEQARYDKKLDLCTVCALTHVHVGALMIPQSAEARQSVSATITIEGVLFTYFSLCSVYIQCEGESLN